MSHITDLARQFAEATTNHWGTDEAAVERILTQVYQLDANDRQNRGSLVEFAKALRDLLRNDSDGMGFERFFISQDRQGAEFYIHQILGDETSGSEFSRVDNFLYFGNARQRYTAGNVIMTLGHGMVCSLGNMVEPIVREHSVPATLMAAGGIALMVGAAFSPAMAAIATGLAIVSGLGLLGKTGYHLYRAATAHNDNDRMLEVHRIGESLGEIVFALATAKLMHRFTQKPAAKSETPGPGDRPAGSTGEGGGAPKPPEVVEAPPPEPPVAVEGGGPQQARGRFGTQLDAGGANAARQGGAQAQPSGPHQPAAPEAPAPQTSGPHQPAAEGGLEFDSAGGTRAFEKAPQGSAAPPSPAPAATPNGGGRERKPAFEMTAADDGGLFDQHRPLSPPPAPPSAAATTGGGSARASGAGRHMAETVDEIPAVPDGSGAPASPRPATTTIALDGEFVSPPADSGLHSMPRLSMVPAEANVPHVPTIKPAAPEAAAPARVYEDPTRRLSTAEVSAALERAYPLPDGDPIIPGPPKIPSFVETDYNAPTTLRKSLANHPNARRSSPPPASEPPAAPEPEAPEPTGAQALLAESETWVETPNRTTQKLLTQLEDCLETHDWTQFRNIVSQNGSNILDPRQQTSFFYHAARLLIRDYGNIFSKINKFDDLTPALMEVFEPLTNVFSENDSFSGLVWSLRMLQRMISIRFQAGLSTSATPAAPAPAIIEFE